MKLKFLSLGVSALALSATAAHATVDKRWYVGLEAGASWVQDADFFASNDTSSEYAGAVSFDTGWAAFGTFGYAFNNGWRAELELGFRTNDAESGCVGAPGDTPTCGPVFGHLDEFTQMLNVIYDWDLGGRWTLSTGLGIGGDYIMAETPFFDDEDYVLAGQALIGVNYQISDRMDVFLNYRYLRTDDSVFSSLLPALEDGDSEFWTSAVDGLEKHAVTVGLRWDLYPTVAKPADIRPDPVRPSKQYIVFFGFNKANLTSEAQGVVAEAAAAAKSMGTASILVTGHTDTVGSSAYNQRLSQRRANVVKDELSRHGVTSQIVTSAKGETELLVQTGDNTKEPQNRRTTIDLQ